MNTTSQHNVYRRAQSTISALPIEGYDGNTHFGGVALALLPALLILSAATGLLVALL